MVRSHVDALFARMTDAPPECTETPAVERTEVNSSPDSVSMAPTLVETIPPTESEEITVPSGTVSVDTDVAPQPAQELPLPPSSPPIRRSTRHRPPPERYGFSEEHSQR